MKKTDAEDLLNKYRSGAALTEKEQAILESWYLDMAKMPQDINFTEQDLQNALKNIQNNLPVYKPVKKIYPSYIVRYSVAAAAVLLFIAVGIFFYSKKTEMIEKMPMAYKNDVAPGDKRAKLTLADNTQIALDDVSLGKIANQTGITISKTATGQLVYVIDDKNIPANAPIQFNTISTPRGGEYKVQLSDGTMVWLNAMSSLRFPTSFKGKERKVEISGEAYFEVAKNAAIPFRVVGGRQVIEVLGTHFNISAYDDEHVVKTTLLEGSVRLSLQKGSSSKILQPGEQAMIFDNENQFTVKKVDLEEAVAWKNGYFIFVDEDIKSIMRKVARWYDIDVVYEGVDPNLKLGGAISRNRNLSQVLNLLELADDNVKFKLKEGRVTIMH